MFARPALPSKLSRHAVAAECRISDGSLNTEHSHCTLTLVPPSQYLHHQEEMNLAIAATVTGRGLPAHIQAERTELAKVIATGTIFAVLRPDPHSPPPQTPPSVSATRASQDEMRRECVPQSINVSSQQHSLYYHPLTDPPSACAALVDVCARDLAWLGIDD